MARSEMGQANQPCSKPGADPASTIVELWATLDEDAKEEILPKLLAETGSWQVSSYDDDGKLFWIKRLFDRHLQRNS